MTMARHVPVANKRRIGVGVVISETLRYSQKMAVPRGKRQRPALRPRSGSGRRSVPPRKAAVAALCP